jgi:hypothetical protein
MPISHSERIDRIAVLLCKAVMLAEAKRMVLPPSSPSPISENRAEAPDIDQRILNYLYVSGEAPPLVIRGALGLARTTAYRSFLRLQQAGHIVGTGRASALVYRLKQQEPPPDRIGLN